MCYQDLGLWNREGGRELKKARAKAIGQWVVHSWEGTVVAAVACEKGAVHQGGHSEPRPSPMATLSYRIVLYLITVLYCTWCVLYNTRVQNKKGAQPVYLAWIVDCSVEPQLGWRDRHRLGATYVSVCG